MNFISNLGIGNVSVKSRRWTWKTGTLAILLLLFIVTNPELRAVLLVFNGLGFELVVFLIGLQLRSFIPASGILAAQARIFLCVAVYAVLRAVTRALGILAPPGRATFGLSTFLFALSKSLWCPLIKSGR
jgi:hypothetical protein